MEKTSPSESRKNSARSSDTLANFTREIQRRSLGDESLRSQRLSHISHKKFKMNFHATQEKGKNAQMNKLIIVSPLDNDVRGEELKQIHEEYHTNGGAGRIQTQSDFQRANWPRKMSKKPSIFRSRGNKHKIGTRFIQNADTSDEATISKQAQHINQPIISKEWEEFHRAFRLSWRHPKIEPPSQFQEHVEEIDDILEMPNPQRHRLIEISDKNGVEKLEYYSNTSYYGRLVKRMLIMTRSLSIISYQIISDPSFEVISLIITFWNCIILAIKDPLTPDAPWNTKMNEFFLAYYSFEMAIKICGLGVIVERKSYFSDPMNIIDAIVVITGYISIVFNLASINLRALRTFRVLRTLRAISSFKALNTIVKSFLNALPLLMNTIFIIFFVLVVFAIAGLQLFSGQLKRHCFDPVTGRIFLDDYGNDVICGSKVCPAGFVCGKMTYNPDNELSNFDTITNAIVVAFQIITLQGWTGVLYETMEATSPVSVIYFLLLVFIGAYFLLNIALAAIKIIFSNHKRKLGEKHRLKYEEKRHIVLQNAKDELLKKIKEYRKDRYRVSAIFKLQSDGKLLEQSPPKEQFYLRIIDSILAKCSWAELSRKIKFLKREDRALEANTAKCRERNDQRVNTENFNLHTAGI